MRTVLPVLIAMSLVAAPTAVESSGLDFDNFGLNPNSSYDAALITGFDYGGTRDWASPGGDGAYIEEFVVRILDAVGRR